MSYWLESVDGLYVVRIYVSRHVTMTRTFGTRTAALAWVARTRAMLAA